MSKPDVINLGVTYVRGDFDFQKLDLGERDASPLDPMISRINLLRDLLQISFGQIRESWHLPPGNHTGLFVENGQFAFGPITSWEVDPRQKGSSYLIMHKLYGSNDVLAAILYPESSRNVAPGGSNICYLLNLPNVIQGIRVLPRDSYAGLTPDDVVKQNETYRAQINAVLKAALDQTLVEAIGEKTNVRNC